MARGNHHGDSDLDLYLMKIVGLKKGEKVTIKQAKPKGEKKEGQKMEYEILPSVQNVSGNLFRAKLREYTYEGEQKYEIQLYLKDAEAKEMVILSCNVNSIGRSLMNTLLNLDGPKGGNLEISVYNKKEDGRATIFIKYDGHKVGWKYDYNTQKELIVQNQITRQGKTTIENDYYKLDQFLMKEFTEKVINEYGTPAQYTQEPATTGGTQAPEGASDNATDDLPF